jgi:hypothetical protein
MEDSPTAPRNRRARPDETCLPLFHDPTPKQYAGRGRPAVDGEITGFSCHRQNQYSIRKPDINHIKPPGEKRNSELIYFSVMTQA